MSACDRLRLPGLLAIVVLMPEELRKIDTSVLNKLVALNEEIQVLEGFCWDESVEGVCSLVRL